MNWQSDPAAFICKSSQLLVRDPGVVGKGVFSTVLKCVDLRAERGKDGKAPPPGPGVGPGLGSGQEQQHVAIKMIRNNDTMRKAAEKEKSILLEIAEKDPENRCIFLSLFTLSFCPTVLILSGPRVQEALREDDHSLRLPQPRRAGLRVLSDEPSRSSEEIR